MSVAFFNGEKRDQTEMDLRQTKINAEYQTVLNTVYSGTIIARGKYINPHAVLQHHCKNCMTKFHARPLWLVNKRQPHECFSESLETSKGKKQKAKRLLEKNTAIPISINAKRVTEEMKIEMVLLYQKGVTISDIRRKLKLAHKTVDYHLKKAGVKGGGNI